MFVFLKSAQKEKFFYTHNCIFLEKKNFTLGGVTVNFRSGLLNLRDRRLRILKSVLSKKVLYFREPS
jgi:hypothetical protein